MKKYKLLLIILLGLGLILAACGGDTAEEPTAAPTEASVEEPAEAPAEEEEMATVELTYLVDDSEANQASAKALADAYMAQHPNVTIIVESRPGGTEGDNIVKTRLATEEMTDIFWYNSGSLLQALNPSETLVDLSNEPFMDNVVESFLPTVTQNGGVFGVPSQTAMGGGILYNKTVYEDLGLSVPTTWEEFAANNEIIKEAGIAGRGESLYSIYDGKV
jgi:raffinose/stachyose/melibiose transport system substrate-binding protein